MASADFPFALTKELSPGKALILSLRAVRLYLARLVWISGFAVAGTLAARTRPLCRFVFLRSKVCFPLPSAWPRGLRPTTSALRFPTVTSIGPDRIVSSCENQPMLGTLAHALLRAVSPLVPTCPALQAHAQTARANHSTEQARERLYPASHSVARSTPRNPVAPQARSSAPRAGSQRGATTVLGSRPPPASRSRKPASTRADRNTPPE